jgi:hypothetical protein
VEGLGALGQSMGQSRFLKAAAAEVLQMMKQI